MTPDRGDTVKTESHRKRRDLEDAKQAKKERNSDPHVKAKDSSKSSPPKEKVKTQDALSVKSKDTRNASFVTAKPKVATSSLGKVNDASPSSSNEKRIERLKSQVKLKQSTSVESHSKGSNREDRIVDKHRKVSLRDTESRSVHERAVKNSSRQTSQQTPYDKIFSKSSPKTDLVQSRNLKVSSKVVSSPINNGDKSVARVSRSNRKEPNAKSTNLVQGHSGSLRDQGESSVIKNQREIKQSSSRSSDAKFKQSNLESKNRDLERSSFIREKNQQGGHKRSTGSRDRTRTRTLSPREVKVLHNVEGINIQKAKDEVHTFLNKTSTPNSEPDPAISGSAKIEVDDEEYDYEDDFEDYESDFEDGSSSDTSEVNDDRKSSSENDGSDLEELQHTQPPPVEEEKKMDSGSYDLAEKKRKNKELQDIKKAIEQENSLLHAKKNESHGKQRLNHTMCDEGFIDEKVEDNIEKTPMTKSGSINFSDALKRKYEQENTAKARKRGEEIISMIRFDIVSFTLLDLEPTPYEIYMKSYGKLNTVQCSVQTNEDNLSEETQTEAIENTNKWTQIPVTYPTSTCKTNVRNEVQIYSQHHLGVGGDSWTDNFDQLDKMLTINSVRLNEFLGRAGQTMLILLEESWNYENNAHKKDQKFTVSDGYFPLNMESLIKENIKITKICFPENNSTTVLAVHECPDNVGTISLWSLLDPSAPSYILSCHSPVSSACFANKANLVSAGLYDGAVTLWDLREELCLQQKKTRSPSYHTAEILKNNGHLTKVVGIEQLTQSVISETDSKTELAHVQLCSVDEDGLIIIWTVVYSSMPAEMSYVSQQDLGMAPWSRVRLVASMMTKLFESFNCLELPVTLHCVYLAVDSSDHIYIGTNTGHIIHCLKSGNKAYPTLYNCSKGKHSCITWIETCPFGAPFFLAGLSDGSVQLYSRLSDTCIWSALRSESCILSIQWARHSPCHFFTLHNDSRLNVWQIHENFISCIDTLELESSITAFQFSPREKYGKQVAYLAIAAISNNVEIHHVQNRYCCHSESEFEKEVMKFEQFANTL